MYKCAIRINSISKAREFVAMTSKYPKIMITLNSREYSVDAHSIVGILSLDLSRPIELIAEGTELDALIADLEPYTV